MLTIKDIKGNKIQEYVCTFFRRTSILFNIKSETKSPVVASSI